METLSQYWGAARDFYGTANSWWTRWIDVTEDLAPLTRRNEEIIAATLRAKAEADGLRSSRAEEASRLRREIAAVRARGAATGAPLLAEFDKTSLAKAMYDQIVGAVESQASEIQRQYDKELASYGYTSKKLFALNLAVESLREKFVSFKPFEAELRALMTEVDNSKDLAFVTAPLLPVASTGLASHELLTVAAHDVAVALTTAATTPVCTVVATTNLFDRFKFRVANGNDAPQPPQTPDEALVSRTELIKSFTEAVAVRDYAAAVLKAEEGLERIPQGTHTAEKAVQLVDAFRAAALPVAMATQALAYCEASISTMRYSFVEPLLKELAEQQQQQQLVAPSLPSSSKVPAKS